MFILRIWYRSGIFDLFIGFFDSGFVFCEISNLVIGNLIKSFIIVYVVDREVWYVFGRKVIVLEFV